MACQKRLHCTIALLPLVTHSALSYSGYDYGFYTFSSASALLFRSSAVNADDAGRLGAGDDYRSDGEKYLQGQITADVSHLTDEQHLLAAHCDAKGKMWSNLRVFRRNEGFAWIERRSLRDAQLTELKKYAVFSKVTIAADDESVLLGVAGFLCARRADAAVGRTAERRETGGQRRRYQRAVV